MIFNFNFKDMPLAARASIHRVTTVRDLHHTGKYRIKRDSCLWSDSPNRSIYAHNLFRNASARSICGNNFSSAEGVREAR